jgi:hypothetical protein
MEPREIETDQQTDEMAAPPPNSHVRDIFIVLIVSWAARLAFICMMPVGARSFDAYSWEHQADLLNSGVNPYQANTLFNWPPVWMQSVFLISKIAAFLSVPFFRVLQLFLILIESAVIVQVMRLIQTIAPAAKARAIVMIGIALNPAAIFLVCQHCNFDVLMAFWVLLAAASLLRYNASNDLIDWLCACLFLGLGILTKTVPLALIPLLAGGFRRATASGKFLGTALVLGPVSLGMSVIFVLAPSEVLHNVLEYRAKGIYFGFPGLLHSMGMDSFAGYFDGAFYILGIGIMILTWRYLWKHHSLGDRETILYIAVVLLSIPGLGPGFGSQYYYWFMPFFVISYAAYHGLWRKLLIGFAIISAITFIIDYGLDRAYGYNFLYVLSQATTPGDLHQWSMMTKNNLSISAIHWEIWMESPSNETMERIPLFIAILTIIFFGARILFLGLQEVRKWVVGLAGIYALCVAMVFAAAFGAKYLWPGTRLAGNPISGQSGQSQVQN